MHRREFLTGLLAGLAWASLGTPGAARTGLAPLTSQSDDPALVVLHLDGGNDGLNTLIPYADRGYARLRGSLALPRRGQLGLNERVALHPALGRTARLFEGGRLAWLPSVGRPDHERDHLTANDLWQTAGNRQAEGWLGRLSDHLGSPPVHMGDGPARVVRGSSQPPLYLQEAMLEPVAEAWEQAALFRLYRDLRQGAVAGSMPPPQGRPQASGPRARSVQASLGDAAGLVEDLVYRQSRLVEGARLGVSFPDTPLGRRLELVSRMLVAGLPYRWFHLSFGDFDTHEGQLPRHSDSLVELDEALDAFWRCLTLHHLERRVVTMGYSEFGRAVAPNARGGTEHGAAGLAFLLGGRVRGGIYGSWDLEHLWDGDLKPDLDYRDLYASVLEHHVGSGCGFAVLGERPSAPELQFWEA